MGKRRIVKPAGHYVTNIYNAKITNFNATDVHSRQKGLDGLPNTTNFITLNYYLFGSMKYTWQQ
eukprot:4210678-Amphidinium_carterae.1